MPAPSSLPFALITGSTIGIGLSIARVLHAEEYAVLVTGQNPKTFARLLRRQPTTSPE
jgi:short-subunit dehydrogenase involved in D-alanine esterification of teichoic acids